MPAADQDVAAGVLPDVVVPLPRPAAPAEQAGGLAGEVRELQGPAARSAVGPHRARVAPLPAQSGEEPRGPHAAFPAGRAQSLSQCAQVGPVAIDQVMGTRSGVVCRFRTSSVASAAAWSGTSPATSSWFWMRSVRPRRWRSSYSSRIFRLTMSASPPWAALLSAL